MKTIKVQGRNGIESMNVSNQEYFAQQSWKLWDVYKVDRIGDRTIETKAAGNVESSSADNACAWICKTMWISRLSLVAHPADQTIPVGAIRRTLED